MDMLKETKPEFAKGQEAQGASYFDIPESQGLAKDFWDVEKGNGKIITVF